MVYGYCRVSTHRQVSNNSFEQQAAEIKLRYPSATIVKEQFTGLTTDRPVLRELIGSVEANDIIVVSKLDRLARTTIEGIELVQELFKKDVAVHILNIGLLEDTSMGRFFLTILLAVAELERNQILERTQSGKMVARQSPDFRDGRPRLYSEKQVKHALQLLQGHTFKQVEEMTGISKSTLIRAKKRQSEDLTEI